jgi:integral membrane protein
VRDPLTRFRVMANVVGVGLLVLVLVAMPLKYLADNRSVIAVVGPLHGFLYMLYVLVAADLSLRARWPLPRMVGILLAGTIPFLSFVVERKVTRRVHAEAAEAEPVG